MEWSASLSPPLAGNPASFGGSPKRKRRKATGERLLHIVLKIFPIHRLRWVDPAVEDSDEQSLVRRGRLLQGRVAALPLQPAAGRVDEREIPARGVFELEHRVRPVRIVFLSEDVHQRDGPLPSFR